MRTALHPVSAPALRAFTLIELIIAMSIMVIVLGAVTSAFFGALRLRDRTVGALERSLPAEEALSIIRADLANLVISTNTNSIFFAPLRTLNQTNILPGQVGPDFYTSRAELEGLVPCGNIEKVDYLLTAAKDGSAGPGQALVRAVTHNLLPVNQLPAPEEQQTLLHGVQSLVFSYYDGTRWDAVWDTTQQTNLPSAIKVQIRLAPQPGALAVNTPLELVVPVDVLLSTNPVTPLQ
jgi:prepilin-type N-terminal cleavage/methylation domain-containing protein